MTLEPSLVVGASGQVGAQIVRVLGADRVLASSREWLDLEDVTGNALARIRGARPGAIYCVGGMTDVEGCESAEARAMRINCEGPAHLAALAAELAIPFAYFSTEYVFDGAAGPYREGDAERPVSVYGRSKWSGERAVMAAHPKALIVRTTVVYGPDAAGKNFLYSLRRVLGEGRELRVPADQISTPTYNADLADATVALVRAGASGVFHVTGAEAVSRYAFAVRAAHILGLNPAQIRPVPTAELGQRAPRPLRAGLICDKLARALPTVRMRGIDAGVAAWIGEGR